MNGWILQVAAAAVSMALLVLTGKGALALTGSREVALVLGALVVIQWVCANKALTMLRRPEERGGLGGRLVRTVGVAVLWLAAALVTVPLVGAELFVMLAAQRIGEVRLTQARQVLLTRAAELQADYTTLGEVIGKVAVYATKAAELERTEGSTCWPSNPHPTGKVRSFWLAERSNAQDQALAVAQAASAATSVRGAIEAIQAQGASAQAREAVATQAVALEQLRQQQVRAGTQAFVDLRLEEGRNLMRGDKVLGCNDTGRSTALKQVQAAVRALPERGALVVPAMFDPTDQRAIAQGALMRTWAAALQVLPQRLLGDWGTIAREDVERFGVPDKVLISDATLPLALAWILESVVLTLMFLQVRGRGVTVGRWSGAFKAMACGVGEWLSGCRGPVGRIARRAAAGMDPAGPWREAPRTGQDFFADATMRQRATELVRYRVSYGGHELILVPLAEAEPLASARELENAGLLRRQSMAVRTSRLLQDARLAPLFRARGINGGDGTHWAVFRVASERFAAWLLAQRASPAATA